MGFLNDPPSVRGHEAIIAWCDVLVVGILGRIKSGIQRLLNE